MQSKNETVWSTWGVDVEKPSLLYICITTFNIKREYVQYICWLVSNRIEFNLFQNVQKSNTPIMFAKWNVHVTLKIWIFKRNIFIFLLPDPHTNTFWRPYQHSCMLFLWHLFRVPVFGSLSLFSEQEGYMDLWSAPGHGPLLNTSYFICSWWMKPCMYVIRFQGTGGGISCGVGKVKWG